MSNLIKDLRGKQFNMLTVIDFAAKPEKSKSKRKIRYWLCECVCGGKTILTTSVLTCGQTKSCGCLNQHTNFEEAMKSSASQVFQTVYNDGDLSFDNFYHLSQQNCYYCGLSSYNSNVINRFVNNLGRNKNNIEAGASDFAVINGNFRYNGLDRVNNSNKHNIDNVVTCCATCNKFKLDLDLLSFIHNIQALKCNTIGENVKMVPRNVLNIKELNKLFPSKLSNGRNALMIRLQHIKSIAKVKNRKFNLSQIDCANLSLSSCIYCDRKSDPENNKFNGIDRIDNNIGYEVNSCVPCCKYCNSAKHNLSLDEFFIWIKRIKAYQEQTQSIDR